MDNLEQEYLKIKAVLNQKQKEIGQLYNEKVEVQNFFKLQKEVQELQEQMLKIIKAINSQNWSTCKHIWLVTKQSYDPGEGRTYNYCSCLKCGLSYEVFDEYETKGKEALNDLTKAQMFEFLQKHPSARYRGLHSNYYANLEETQNIYRKIKKRNPDLSDEIVLQLIEEQLNKKKGLTRKRKG